MKALRITILTNILPKYREGFYDALFRRRDVHVKVYCQDKIPGADFETIHEKYGRNVALLNYLSASREKIAWQFIPWKKILAESDVIFIGGNPRVVSDALFATFLSLFRKRIVLWTMARSFRNNRLSENIRLFWTRLFRHILVYTDEEAEYLRHRGFGDHYVLGINNGLDQAAIDRAAADWPDVELNEWRKAGGLDGRVLILSCARLEPKNRLDQVVEALPFIVTRVPNVLWCIIGSGTKLRELIAMVDRVGGSEHVRFVGGTYDEKELAPWFLSSELLIHPAAVGLSLIHAYGYGLPAVLNDNPRAHGPEYAAFESGKTGWAYRENDPKDLAEKIVRLLTDKESRKTMGAYAYGLTKDKYNVDIMADRFVQIAREAFRSRRHEIQRHP